MAESKFLKYQDIDRDGVIDVCDDDLTTPELPCKGPCTPDPTSIVPDWKKQDIFSPFLNTKICHFKFLGMRNSIIFFIKILKFITYFQCLE